MHLSPLVWRDVYRQLPMQLEKFYMLGIDGYFTDYPNTVRSFLDGKDCSRSLEAPNEMSGGLGRLSYLFLQGIYQNKWIHQIAAISAWRPQILLRIDGDRRWVCLSFKVT